MVKTIIPHTKIIEVTSSNMQYYINFLVNAMQSEFPQDEQLPRKGIEERIQNKETHNRAIRSFVKVISENDVPLGFIIYHLIKTETGNPTSLWEYAAVVGINKGRGLGTQLFNDAYDSLCKEGVQDRVGETEPVPRIVKFKVHKDVEGCYIDKDERTIFAKNPTEVVGDTPRYEAIYKRNKTFEKMGLRIITEFGYCQPNLNPDIKEQYTGQYRVPLDLQISNLNDEEINQISGKRIREIVSSIIRHNYKLGEQTDEFLNHFFKYDHQGRRINDSTIFKVERYRDLIKSTPTIDAYSLLNLPLPQ